MSVSDTLPTSYDQHSPPVRRLDSSNGLVHQRPNPATTAGTRFSLRTATLSVCSTSPPYQQLSAIKAAALNDDYAYRQVTHLTENIGPRPTGSASLPTPP